MLDVEYQGLFKAIADDAVPAYAPEASSPMRLIGFTMNAVAKKIQSLSINLNNVLAIRPDPNASADLRSNAMPETEIGHIQVTDNDPTISINPEAELVATYAADALRRARTEHAIEAVFSDGTDTITIAMPKVQSKGLVQEEREGILAHAYEGQLNHTATGDDALVITVT